MVMKTPSALTAAPFISAVDAVRRISEALLIHEHNRSKFYQMRQFHDLLLKFDHERLKVEVLEVILTYSLKWITFINTVTVTDVMIDARDLERLGHINIALSSMALTSNNWEDITQYHQCLCLNIVVIRLTFERTFYPRAPFANEFTNDLQFFVVLGLIATFKRTQSSRSNTGNDSRMSS
eukprot:scaffold191383_cov41-Prasinocladus_malaysianus.AAC.2